MHRFLLSELIATTFDGGNLWYWMRHLLNIPYIRHEQHDRLKWLNDRGIWYSVQVDVEPYSNSKQVARFYIVIDTLADAMLYTLYWGETPKG